MVVVGSADFLKMGNRMKSSKFLLGLVLASASTVVLAGPIGSVDSKGWYQIEAGSGETVRFNSEPYTFHSGDTLTSQGEATVLNLDSGGGIGLPKGATVRVERSESGAVEIVLEKGALLYAFPNDRQDFTVRVGNFTASPKAHQARALRVSSQGESVGTVEHLADGNIKVMVRSGELFVENGPAVRYQVAAGESVGLLDLAPQALNTQSGGNVPSQPLILLQSPERVGTNENFLVRWETANPVQGDYVVIAKSGAEPDEFDSLVSSDEGQVLEFEAPGRPGDYEIRFIDGQTGAIKRFVYLDVVENLVAAYWWRDPVGPIVAVAGAGLGVYIGTEIADDDDPEPVSP